MGWARKEIRQGISKASNNVVHRLRGKYIKPLKPANLRVWLIGQVGIIITKWLTWGWKCSILGMCDKAWPGWADAFASVAQW